MHFEGGGSPVPAPVGLFFVGGRAAPAAATSGHTARSDGPLWSFCGLEAGPGHGYQRLRTESGADIDPECAGYAGGGLSTHRGDGRKTSVDPG